MSKKGKNKIACLLVEVDESESYLYTDIRRVNKKVRDMNNDCIIFEFRNTLNNEWESLFQKVDEDNYKEIKLYNNSNRCTDEFVKVLKYLKYATWNSSIDYPENGLYDCPHCDEEVFYSEIRTCDSCDELMCSNCSSLYCCDVHDDCDLNEECDGTCECCEDTICYNDNCEEWDSEDHFEKTKSEWDTEIEFRAGLDPNDPADAWFFED
jgi:hypothetical protein